MNKYSLTTSNPEETIAIAAEIGGRLKGGELIILSSDLGGGKTTFTKGLIKGAGSTDNAKSPSFTLQNEYKTKDLVIHHLDFYRLDDPGIMSNMLSEVMEDEKSVVVIEWADIVESILPRERLVIEILSAGDQDNIRQINLNYSDKYNYLVNLTS
jgi:tRNA threonylcarbamoyladenosine biosynthesis protein TsaE